jgi:cytochrome c oxidase subunit 2
MCRRILTLLPFILLAGAVWWMPLDGLAAPPSTRQVTIRASQFAFDPPVLRVNRGDRVVVTLQSSDVVHGLYLDGYGINVRVEPGLSKHIEFVADKTGKFRYRCPVSCGSLHPFMVGELVVAPNDMFARALGLTALAVLATLVFLRRFPAGHPAGLQDA